MNLFYTAVGAPIGIYYASFIHFIPMVSCSILASYICNKEIGRAHV